MKILNKKGLGPSLTWILISMVIFISVVGFAYNAYYNFVNDNSLMIDSKYEEYYQNLTEQKPDIYGIGNEMGQRGLLDKIWDAGGAGANLFIVGLSAIGTFFGMIPIFGKIFSILGEAMPGLSGLMDMGLVILTIYIAMKYIQAKIGKVEEP